jgi:hypothetical protein
MVWKMGRSQRQAMNFRLKTRPDDMHRPIGPRRVMVWEVGVTIGWVTRGGG